MVSSSKVRAVLFDLDGTLADTSPDLTDTLNELLSQHGKNMLDYELVRNHTSRGSVAMIELGFNQTLEEERRTQLQGEFFRIYENKFCNKTKLFPGVTELLDFLDQASIPWGIVTNKPGKFAEPLVQKLDIAFRATCMVSGDSLTRKKPSPDQLHHAAIMIGIDETDCVYIGDDPRDIQAGKAAKMKTAAAAYGYVQENDDPHSWGADIVLNNALELKDWLFNHS